jgi:hypothetical protein
MTGRNKTGPNGRGRMSGRGLGGCAGSDRLDDKPASAPIERGRGLGRRSSQGAGRGCGRGEGGGASQGRGRGSVDQEPSGGN